MAPSRRLPPPSTKKSSTPPKTRFRHVNSFLILALAIFILFLVQHRQEKASSSWPSALSVAEHPTVVVYVFGGSDPEYEANLRFFIDEAVRTGDRCEYIIVIQEELGGGKNSSGSGSVDDRHFPPLPPNARYVVHPNECFDWGTVGWVFKTVLKDTKTLARAKRFIWLNSSVRGPFLPPYVRGKLHWTRPFTDRLSSTVKLVGSTISCGGAQGLPGQPHVQSYVVATDRIGLTVLEQTSGVFDCWKKMGDVVVHSEIGASRAILNAGYAIDSLMAKYVNTPSKTWTSAADQGLQCNGGLNPLQPSFNDGIDVNPFEVLFIKVKESFLKGEGWVHAKAATRIAEWYTDSMPFERNRWLEGPAQEAHKKALRRGIECFDWEFYLNSNRYDLEELRRDEGQGTRGRDAAWHQFLRMGIYEGRPHRWTC